MPTELSKAARQEVIGVSLGDPQLLREITGEIQRTGPITFARFMELALYHPLHGYYMRGREDDAGEPIGWSGDFYTSSDLHPALAQSLARQVRQIDELLGCPDRFTVLEMGAGKGLLARDFLADCEVNAEPFFARLHYVIIERSLVMKARQRRQLAPWMASAGRVSWLNGLEGLATGGLVGVALSNELVDAFPVHRIRVDQGEAEEVFVDYEGGRFCERLRPVSNPELLQYLDRLTRMGVKLADGYTTEMNLHAMVWMREVARILGHGVVITIDYGHTAPDLYAPERGNGTLLCYHQHRLSEHPYVRVGCQDMTAHVDFSALAAVGQESGLHVTGFTNQMSFLIGLGLEDKLASLEPGSSEFESMVRLLRPEGMGRTFKVLVQHKGLDQPELDGLRFKPFFESSLTVAGGNGQ